MNLIRPGIDPDPKTVAVRLGALAKEGFTAASFGLSEHQLRHHLDPCHEPELFELVKMDPVGRNRLWGWLSGEHKAAINSGRPNRHAKDAPPGIDPDQINSSIRSARAAIPRPNGEAAEEEQTQAGEGVSLDDFRAFMEMRAYIFTPSGAMWPASSVNSRVPPIPLFKKDGEPHLDKNGNQRKTSAAAWLDKHRPVETMTWVPGEPMLIPDRLISDGGWITRKGVTCFNLYRPPLIIARNGAEARRWLDHADRIFPGAPGVSSASAMARRDA